MSEPYKIEGQTRSTESLARVRETISQRAEDDVIEAAKFAEDIVRWMNEQWNERSFSAEQRIFSLSLAYINFAEQFPANKGGVDEFVRVYKLAREYFVKNSNE